jgi:mRNA interferase RelE/StbE
MIVQIDDKAMKDLSRLDKKEATKILIKIESLESFPNVSSVKKLTNFIPPYRLRVGDYRILFDVENHLLTVYRIKHRSNAY